MSKSTNTVVYIDWKTVIYIYAWLYAIIIWHNISSVMVSVLAVWKDEGLRTGQTKDLVWNWYLLFLC
jgi:hypothetical protein